LGARYLVTGSVRPTGKDFRLTVNLIEAETGLNLWSHRYQIDFSKFLDTQDEISASIVSVLDPEIERAEQTRLRTREVKDLDSWELIRRGIWHTYKFTEEDAAPRARASRRPSAAPLAQAKPAYTSPGGISGMSG